MTLSDKVQRLILGTSDPKLWLRRFYKRHMGELMSTKRCWWTSVKLGGLGLPYNKSKPLELDPRVRKFCAYVACSHGENRVSVAIPQKEECPAYKAYQSHLATYLKSRGFKQLYEHEVFRDNPRFRILGPFKTSDLKMPKVSMRNFWCLGLSANNTSYDTYLSAFRAAQYSKVFPMEVEKCVSWDSKLGWYKVTRVVGTLEESESVSSAVSYKATGVAVDVVWPKSFMGEANHMDRTSLWSGESHTVVSQ